MADEATKEAARDEERWWEELAVRAAAWGSVLRGGLVIGRFIGFLLRDRPVMNRARDAPALPALLH